MGAEPLLPVEEALSRLLAVAKAHRLPEEMIPVAEADSRVLAADLVAQRTQPPFAVSAMDGYAVIAQETQTLAPLHIVGESAAGHAFTGLLEPGQAVRIFTGAQVPEGANAVLLQEDATRMGDHVTPRSPVAEGRHIRPAGVDFKRGQALLHAGERITPAKLALAAAMNHAEVAVSRRPRIAILATGDELAMPGADAPPEAIIASNSLAIAAMARRVGADARDFGIAKDTREAHIAAFTAARDWGADVLVTIGGASVGEHDLVRPIAAEMGAEQAFYRIALRPGKPLNFGTLGKMLLLGLPGNPVSAIICAKLFLLPLLATLQGDNHPIEEPEPAFLGRDMPANDARQDYQRARLTRGADGKLVAHPVDNQDSSLLSRLAAADCLLIRPPHAPAAKAGDACVVLRL
jgi:molybdopterin molybdotransferase